MQQTQANEALPSRGGSYRRVDGVLELVESTKPADAAVAVAEPASPDAPQAPVSDRFDKQSQQPAAAGAQQE